MTVCNPLNLSYRFQLRDVSDVSFREAADPSVVFHEGRYWLFASKSGGFWHSRNLRDWTFQPSRVLPAEDYAPDVRVVDGRLHVTATRFKDPAPIFRAIDPMADQWEQVDGPIPHSDPNLFEDEDGKVYLYWGCSNKAPLRGMELDSKTLSAVGMPSDLVRGDPAAHGWERGPDDNAGEAAPWVEGAWMTRHRNRYYLQYSAPGTEFNVYADGVYVGDAPLGPFSYDPNSPFSFKPGGFINGAGHGSTFQDPYGNWWHMATMRISVRHMYERRIGLFPAGFDDEGILFCNTCFGDYPMRLPAKRWNPWRDAFAGWMLLSWRKPVDASSTLSGFGTEAVVDENVRTQWSAASGGDGEWLRVDLQKVCTVHAVQVNFAEQDCDQFGHPETPLFHRYDLDVSTDGRHWQPFRDRERADADTPHDYAAREEGVQARFVRVTNRHMPATGKFALSGLRVFGLAPGTPPAPVSTLRIRRDAADSRRADVDWQGPPDAVGYNVRWGLAPDKLYHSWMVYGQNELCLRALNRDVPYWAAVDVFNESGVAEGVPTAMDVSAD